MYGLDTLGGFFLVDTQANLDNMAPNQLICTGMWLAEGIESYRLLSGIQQLTISYLRVDHEDTSDY